VFTGTGGYPVELTITGHNNCVASTSKIISVPVPLTPDFSVQKACNDQSTIFTDATATTTDPVTDRHWKFGDIGTSTGSPVTFTFENTGSFNVILDVTAASGCVYSGNRIVNIIPAPVASFTASPEAGVPPLNVQFTNNSTNAIDYRWAFNDNLNSTSQEVSPSFLFSDFGDYVVDLTAINAHDCSNTFSKIITAGFPVSDIALTAFSITENADGSLRGIVTLKNNGNARLQNVKLAIDLSGATMVRENVEGPIEANALYNYVIGYDILNTHGLHYVCAEVQLDNDLDPDNNKLCSNVNAEELFWLHPYPLPAEEELHVDWVAKEETDVHIKLVDALGKEVSFIKGQSAVGLNQVILPTGQLKKGIYILILQAGKTKKMLRVAVDGN
jgi:PKD repeat protein